MKVSACRWKTVVKETFKSSKFHFDEAKLDKIACHLVEMYKTTACWQHSYGVPGILTYIQNKNIPIGVISNFDPRLDAILINTKLKHYFQFVLSSYEVIPVNFKMQEYNKKTCRLVWKSQTNEFSS